MAFVSRVWGVRSDSWNSKNICFRGEGVIFFKNNISNNNFNSVMAGCYSRRDISRNTLF